MTFTAASDSWSLASLAAGQSVTLQLAGTVPSGATGATYVNTASASAADASTVTATDSDTLTAHATLAITKTDNDGGSSISSHHRLGHAGDLHHLHGRGLELRSLDGHRGDSHRRPRLSNAAIASDTWTATGSAGATGFSASGTGSINDSSTIPAGGTVTYTVTAAIRSSATGTLTNTATASASDASTVTATDSDSLTAQATLTITKTDGVSSVTAGTTDTYTVVVSNTGPSDASNLNVVDTLPTQGFSNISSPNLPSGVTFTAASDSWSLASLAAGQSVTLQLAGTVPSGATGATYVNTASASAADASTVTATDSDTLTAQATLAITKTDNDGGSSVTSTVGSATPGTSITYTVVASNAGPSTATGVSVTDALGSNAAISSDTWTATGSGGATGYSASGSGNIGDSSTIPPAARSPTR